MNLKGRHFLTLLDYKKDEIEYLLDLAIKMKKGQVKRSLKDKSLAMLFQKASTRTRVSFEVGMTQLEGHALFMDMSTTQLGRGETVGDTRAYAPEISVSLPACILPFGADPPARLNLLPTREIRP